MADLIDREVLLKGLEVLDDKFLHRVKTEDRGFLALQAGLTYARFLVEDAPAVAAEPVVRHGQWTGWTAGAYMGRTDEFGDPVYADRKYFRCSVCRYGSVVKHRFCPGCGAHMDGQGEGGAK